MLVAQAHAAAIAIPSMATIAAHGVRLKSACFGLNKFIRLSPMGKGQPRIVAQIGLFSPRLLAILITHLTGDCRKHVVRVPADHAHRTDYQNQNYRQHYSIFRNILPAVIPDQPTYLSHGLNLR
jgi:hypothetical protein